MTYPKQSKSVHIEVLNDELCLYDWQRKEAHALNATAAQVWRMCDGATSPAQMAAQLRATQSPALNDTQAEALVNMSLQELTQARLLAETGAVSQNVLTRRQVLKVLGGAAAGAVLLPAISSIVAPSPVAAQSPVAPVAPTATPTVAPTIHTISCYVENTSGASTIGRGDTISTYAEITPATAGIEMERTIGVFTLLSPPPFSSVRVETDADGRATPPDFDLSSVSIPWGEDIIVSWSFVRSSEGTDVCGNIINLV